MKNKKGQAIEGLQSLVVPLIGIAIVLVIGFLIMAQAKEQIVTVAGNVSYAYNATEDVQNAMADIPGWLPIIVITVIGALLLGLVANFGGLGGRR